MSATNHYYESMGEIEAVVRSFESCATPPSDFNHCAHLTVAFSYLHLYKLSMTDATERMRAGLYRFLDHNGVDRGKYNETITIFWIKLVRRFLEGIDTERHIADIANEMLDAFGNSQLIFEYYNKERLSTEQARAGWVEPDKKPIDF